MRIENDWTLFLVKKRLKQRPLAANPINRNVLCLGLYKNFKIRSNALKRVLFN